MQNTAHLTHTHIHAHIDICIWIYVFVSLCLGQTFAQIKNRCVAFGDIFKAQPAQLPRFHIQLARSVCVRVCACMWGTAGIIAAWTINMCCARHKRTPGSACPLWRGCRADCRTESRCASCGYFACGWLTYHFGSLFSYIVLIAVNEAVLWFPSVVAQHCVALSLFDSLFATLYITGVLLFINSSNSNSNSNSFICTSL